MRNNGGKGYSLGTVVRKLKTKNSKSSVAAALRALQNRGAIVLSNGLYRWNPNGSNTTTKKIIQKGRTDLTSSGAAYIVVEGQQSDIYVPAKHVEGALQGDIVRVEVTFAQSREKPRGRIIEVLQRHRTRFIGTFQDAKKYGYVYVEGPKLSLEVRILPQDYNGATGGDSVVVEIKEFGTARRPQLRGAIHQVLNPDNRNDFEMQRILINSGFDIVFDKEVLEEAESLKDGITSQDIAQRRDMRDVLTFTIDPVDAKDFDDAISYEKLESGHTRIGIHIADVTHFVKENTVLDKEAYRRSTSVYLVDRVCPMLPERISNELCSLRPNEDKFCFSVVIDFDEAHQIAGHWIGKTLIHSDYRFAYEAAQESLDGDQELLEKELMHINDIAKTLNRKRFESGSINFETDEIRFELSADGKPLSIHRKVRQDAHRLIEEYMLLANKIVARHLGKKSKGQEVPFVYRIHDVPNPEKLAELALLAGEFGIKLRFDTPEQITRSLNQLSDEGSDDDLRSILRMMAIRSMSKAVYATDNIGHYGLGFEYYTHFTSPIRRYADVLVHRILYANLDATHRRDIELLERQCLYISQKERDATSAERESIKYKQVEYLSDRVGEEFEGMIRNIIDRGIFVELLESQADGFLPMDRLGENLMIHPARIKVTGQSTGKVWRIGDRVSVVLTSIDMEKRQLNFALAE